jgi:glyoxalase/bleomycin resistance protein/dioxygenase superfamily protein
MPISVSGLAPLLQVYDMPASIRFYRDTLGFTVGPPRSRLSARGLEDVP